MVRIIKGQEAIEIVAKKLQIGYIVSFPTETVYGLGADARHSMAVTNIYEIKGRPSFNPLIVHIKTVEEAQEFGIFDSLSYTLAQKFWPGPLTIVVPKKPDCGISDLVTAGLDTIALRVPRHPIAREFLKHADCPVAAPSANLSGHVSPTTAQHVADDFAHTDLLIVDGGDAECGLESTVVTCTDKGVFILRHGSIAKDEIQDVLGQEVFFSTSAPDQPVSPGQLIRHYAPKAPIRLNAAEVFETEALLAFGKAIPYSGIHMLNLSPSENLQEAAANLFSMLRELDRLNVKGIAVMPIPDEGLGISINDRLKRAAEQND